MTCLTSAYSYHLHVARADLPIINDAGFGPTFQPHYEVENPLARGQTALHMDKKSRAKFILNDLEKRFPDVPIPLHFSDSYTLLIAVLLSAQCTDTRVNKITPLLFTRAKSPQQMILMSVQEIEDIIRPCGLASRKAKAIWDLSKLLIEKFQGQVPEDIDALETLPGVGHKTASVVMAQAFGHNTFPVDTHIHRLAQRWGLSSGKSVEETERDLKLLFPEETWGKLHLQFIYYGREVCQARGCDGLRCPMCEALNSKPVKKITKKKPLLIKGKKRV